MSTPLVESTPKYRGSPACHPMMPMVPCVCTISSVRCASCSGSDLRTDDDDAIVVGADDA
jgi:hypothetical protein